MNLSQKIFVAYRRKDSESESGRITDFLTRKYRPGTVFKDVNTIEIGDDFQNAITVALNTIDVLIVVIGPDWLGACNSRGESRLFDSDDLHRKEIETAQKAEKAIIPLLVGGATSPSQKDLPGSLNFFARLNPAIVRDKDPDFIVDMERICTRLEKLVPALKCNEPQKNSLYTRILQLYGSIIGVLPHLMRGTLPSSAPMPSKTDYTLEKPTVQIIPKCLSGYRKIILNEQEIFPLGARIDIDIFANKKTTQPITIRTLVIQKKWIDNKQKPKINFYQQDAPGLGPVPVLQWNVTFGKTETKSYYIDPQGNAARSLSNDLFDLESPIALRLGDGEPNSCHLKINARTTDPGFTEFFFIFTGYVGAKPFKTETKPIIIYKDQ